MTADMLSVPGGTLTLADWRDIHRHVKARWWGCRDGLKPERLLVAS